MEIGYLVVESLLPIVQKKAIKGHLGWPLEVCYIVSFEKKGFPLARFGP